MPRMSEQTLIIYGAGDHGLVVANAAQVAGWKILGLVDDADRTGRPTVTHWPFLGRPDAGIEHTGAKWIVAVGDNAARVRCLDRVKSIGARLATVIHPDASVSPLAQVAPGAFIGPRAIVHAEAQIGMGAVINSGAIIEHHNQVGEATHIAPGVTLCGRVKVGDRVLIGAGAIVLPGLSIGDDAVVGAGAVVTHDVPSGACAVGNPARPR